MTIHGFGVHDGLGVGVGVGGTSKPLTRKMTPPLFVDQNSKSPVRGAMKGPSLAPNPTTTSCVFATIGSPVASRGAVTILPDDQLLIRTLLAGNAGEPGGTKTIPSGSSARVARRDAEITSNVPLPSGTKSQSYHSPLADTIFMLP